MSDERRYVHGYIQTARGMCTDERPYVEIDELLGEAVGRAKDVEAEREWLLSFLRGDVVGMSAENLIHEAITGRPTPRDFWPCDDGDLGRCRQAVESAPDHLRRVAERLYAARARRLVARRSAERSEAPFPGRVPDKEEGE